MNLFDAYTHVNGIEVESKQDIVEYSVYLRAQHIIAEARFTHLTAIICAVIRTLLYFITTSRLAGANSVVESLSTKRKGS